MYKNLFGFKRRPFVSVPDLELYYPGETIEAARQTLIRSVERGEGPGLLLGPSGTGKTLLCKLLTFYFEKRVPVALLCAGRLGSRADLLRTILYELGQPYRNMDEGEARIALVDFLTSREDSPKAALLLVDEAHTLPLRLLDELRMLGNLAVGTSPVLRLVLAGGMVLEEHLANPKLECLSQRISTRCYLESLDGCETAAYIASQVEAVGQVGRQPTEDLFTEKAARAVFQATDGVPRLVNQVCDHALLLAYNRGKSVISAAEIEEAWAELQQLPTPWNDEPAEASGVVEFGSLEDDLDDLTPVLEASSDLGASPHLQILVESQEESDEESEGSEGSEESGRLSSELEMAGLGDPFEPSGHAAFGELEEDATENLEYGRALNPFVECFEAEEVIAPRPVQVGLLCGEVEANLPTEIRIAKHAEQVGETLDFDESESKESRDEVVALDGRPNDVSAEGDERCTSSDEAEEGGVRPTRPVSVAFKPSFPLPEFSWPDPQYGYSPLPRSKSVCGPVPGSGHLKRPG